MVTSRVLVHPYAISWVSLDTLWRSYGGFQNDGTVNGKFHLVGASKGCRGIRQGMYKFSTCQVWNEKGHRPTLPVTSTSPPLGGSLAGFHHRLTFISRKYCDSVSGGSFFKRHPFGNVAHSPYFPHCRRSLYGYCRKAPWNAPKSGFWSRSFVHQPFLASTIQDEWNLIADEFRVSPTNWQANQSAQSGHWTMPSCFCSQEAIIMGEVPELGWIVI